MSKTIEERLELLEAQLDGSRLRARIAELEKECDRLRWYKLELERLKRELGMPDNVIVAQSAINSVNDLRVLIARLLPDAPRMPGTENDWLRPMVHEDEWLRASGEVTRLQRLENDNK